MREEAEKKAERDLRRKLLAVSMVYAVPLRTLKVIS